MKSLFITFEGGEGSGKTTIIETLKKELMTLGFDVIQTREPGGSRIAEQIRKVILDKENTELDPLAEALLYAASRRQHLKEVVIPALQTEKIVLCDRYIDSSLVYQGYARGIGIEEVYEMNQFATNGLLPNLTLLIDLDPNKGLERIKYNQREVNRLDLEQLSFHEKVRCGYLEVQKRFPNRIKLIDGARTLEAVYQDVLQEVKQILQDNTFNQ